MQLVADHGLTISDYEVLLRLSWDPECRLRRVDLAEQVLLTASGITRLLDGLERGGLVAREPCGSDRRVVYAVLTDAGRAKVEEATATHFAQIDELFAERFDRDELAAVTGLMGRLGGFRQVPCVRRRRKPYGSSAKFCQYRLGVGPRCPWYLEPIPSEPYGRSAGSDSCTNEIWPIFIPG